MSHEARVGIVLVSHSAALAEGTARATAGEAVGGWQLLGVDDGAVRIRYRRETRRLPITVEEDRTAAAPQPQ